ncbi:MAG: hypothetical protein ABIP85_02200, partial [Chthoniobacteraceae bacterium]
KEMKVSDAKQIPDGPFDILEIYVKGEFVTDAEFALLSQAPRLRNIRLDLDNHLTSLKPLAGLKELTSLSLAHPSSGTCRELSEREVAHLAGLTRLKFLDLRLKESTGEECEYLRELKSLTSLNVGNVRLSAKGAETIASLTQLKSLSMVIPDDASEKNLGPIGKLANLEFLALRDSVVTAQSFSVISQLPKLRKLDLSGAKLDNAGFALITGSRGTMKVLNVDMSANVSDEGIRNIVANFPNLEEINLSMGSACTGASIRELAKLPQLKKMSCWVMKGLKPNDYILFADLPAIEHLSFEGTAITDEALPAFQKCQHLQTLNLPNNAITDAGLEHLKNILSLRNLKLQGTNVTDAGLAAFQQARPVVTVTR